VASVADSAVADPEVDSAEASAAAEADSVAAEADSAVALAAAATEADSAEAEADLRAAEKAAPRWWQIPFPKVWNNSKKSVPDDFYSLAGTLKTNGTLCITILVC